MNALPPYISPEKIMSRLPFVFPFGTPNRKTCVREMSARVIFTMIYFGAIEGSSVRLKPFHITRMTNEQSLFPEAENRVIRRIGRKRFRPVGRPWYSDGSCGQIKNHILIAGLIPAGAVKSYPAERHDGVLCEYFLDGQFVKLFDPALEGELLQQCISEWRDNHFNKSIYEMKTLIDAAITPMTPRRGQIFRMSRIENYSNSEIAERLGISEGTVRHHLAAAAISAEVYIRKNSSFTMMEDF